jgi:hypothetical protein
MNINFYLPFVYAGVEQLLREFCRAVKHSACERPRISCGTEVPAGAGGNNGSFSFGSFVFVDTKTKEPVGYKVLF